MSVLWWPYVAGVSAVALELMFFVGQLMWRKWRHGIHKRAHSGVGGSTGADAAPGARETALGTSVTPTAGYARVSITNVTTPSGGAGTSVIVPIHDKVIRRPSGGYAHHMTLPSAKTVWPTVAGPLNFSAAMTTAEFAKYIAAFNGGQAPAPPLRQMGKLTDYVIGWREWDFDQRSGYLVALNRHFGAWRPGQNTAVCRAPSPGIHRSPDPTCSCGFHLRYGLAATDGMEAAFVGTVIGAVRCWGRIIEHPPQGFRAEHVEIVALLDNFGGLASLAVERYGVPLLKYEDLKSYAYEFGRALPGPEAEA